MSTQSTYLTPTGPRNAPERYGWTYRGLWGSIMQRRKFLIGAGAASTGGALVLGSGAFSRVESDRAVEIQVAEDPDAYLGLDECDTPHGENYVEIDEYGHLFVDISENPHGGEGVNSNSQTWFHNVFEICNQGKEDVCLWIDDDDWPIVEEGEHEGEPRVDFYLGDDDEESILGAENAKSVSLGECTCVGIKTNSHGIDATADETLLESLGDEIRLIADVSAPVNTAVNANGESVQLIGSTSTVSSNDPLEATSLDDPGLSPEDLAESLVAEGEDIEVVEGSVEFIGDEEAGGSFSGGDGVIGIEDGVILSSGKVTDVEGPNESASTSTAFGTPGDDDLDDLVDGVTYDAAILEFEFTVPDDADQVYFDYVFGSEEYNEYVGSTFNDVFALWVNDENAALVPDPDNPGETLPAAINNINHGWGPDDYDPVNEDLFINNDPFHGHLVIYDPLDEEEAPHDTEMDGFTVPLLAEADVDPDGTNTMKLAIADVSDAILDSWVLIEGGSLTIEPPEPDPGPC